MELATVAAIAPVVFSLLKKIGKFVDVKDGEKKKLNNDNQQQKDVLKKESSLKATGTGKHGQQFNVTYFMKNLTEAEIITKLETVQSQINVINVETLQVSKLSAAFSFLQKVLVYLKSIYEEKIEIKTSFESAMSMLHEANNNATEAFKDKINVPIKFREEAMQIMLFCSAVEFYNNAHKIISNWKSNMKDYFDDEEISAFYKGQLASVKENAKYSSKLHFIFGELVIVINSMYELFPDIEKERENFLRLIYRPSFVTSDKEQLCWLQAECILSEPDYPQVPVHIMKDTNRCCALPNNCIALLGQCCEDNVWKICLKVVNVWDITKELAKIFPVTTEKDNVVKSGFCNGSLVYHAGLDLILHCNCFTGNITYFKYDCIKQKINIVSSVPVNLPKKIPKVLLSDEKVDSNSSWCFINIAAISGTLFCYERNNSGIYNYIWDGNKKEWKSINKFPPENLILCVTSAEEEGFLAIICNRKTNQNFRAHISKDGEFLSSGPTAIRNETCFVCFSFASRKFFAYSKTVDNNGAVTSWDVESYDILGGKLLASKRLPTTEDGYNFICEVGGRLFVCSS